MAYLSAAISMRPHVAMEKSEHLFFRTTQGLRAFRPITVRLISRQILLIILLTAISILVYTGPVHSASQTYLGVWSRDYLSPHIADPLLEPGSVFTVEVNATDIPPVINQFDGGATAFDITVTYDPSVLTATHASHTSPECPASEGCLFDLPNQFALHKSINNTSGTVRLAAVSLSGAVDGSGTIFRIGFQVLGISSTVIDIIEKDSLLVGPVAGGPDPVAPIPYQDVDGSFDNRSEVKDIAVLDVRVSDIFVTVGEPVTITATITNQGFTTEIFLVRALVDFYLPCDMAIGTQTLRLAPGQTATASFVLDTAGITCRTVSTYITVPVPGDVDIADNSRTGPTVTLNRRPVAAFTMIPGSPVVGQSVQFDPSQSSDPDGEIATYVWFFGDGYTDTVRVPTHIYNATGTYDVTLEVTDGDGDVSTTSRQVTVASATGPQPPGPQSPVAPLELPRVILYSAAGALGAVVVAVLLVLRRTRKQPE